MSPSPLRFVSIAVLLIAPARGADTILIDEGAAALALVPSVANGGSTLGANWTGVDDPANLGQWQTGTTAVGYEAGSGYQNLIDIDVIAMQGVNESVFVRVPFNLDAAALAEVRALTLNMKYDDGFVAWINGVRVADANAPADPVWDSGATGQHADNAAVVFEEFDASSAVGSLRQGSNVLAIQGLNDGSNSSDLLVLPQLVASDVEPPEPPVWPRLRVTEVVSGLSRPVDIQNAGDGSGRLFVLEKPGRVRIIENGSLLPTPFLDIVSRVDDRSNEEGLLGIAFPTGFGEMENPHFYVSYTDTTGSRISRFAVDGADPNRALANSEQILLTTTQPFGNHNGGQIQFGPDGFLYIGFGDGGSGDDPGDRAQNRTIFLGKMLRIDVEGPPDAGKPFAVPPSNPFVGNPSTLDEIWALGLRNPWRFSFDSLTGDLWIADVGQGGREEVDFQPADSLGGENYGWRYFEGINQYITTGVVPTSPVPPIHDYGRAVGQSITGGYVYRGSRYPRMDGVYFFTDYEDNDRFIFGIKADGAGGWVDDTLFTGFGEITTFGEDEDGELYFATDSGSNMPNRIFALADSRDAEYLEVTALSAAPDSGVEITIGTEIDEQYQLQMSGDLVLWSDVGAPVTASALRTVFSAPAGGAGAGRQFVRVMPLP